MPDNRHPEQRRRVFIYACPALSCFCAGKRKRKSPQAGFFY